MKKYILLINQKTINAYTLDEIVENSSILYPYISKDIKDGIDISYENGYPILTIQENRSLKMKINGKMALSTTLPLRHNDFVTFLYHNGNDVGHLLYWESKNLKCNLIRIDNGSSISIGKGDQNNIQIIHPMIDDYHAKIKKNNAQTTFEYPTDSQLIYINKINVDEIPSNPIQLNIGDHVQILTCIIYNIGAYLCIIGEYELNHVHHYIPEQQNEDSSLIQFKSVPRIAYSLIDRNFVIDPPPPMTQKKELPFLLEVGPSLTMALVMLTSSAISISNALTNGINGTFITSALMAVSMLAGALIWPWQIRCHHNKQAENAENNRKVKYANYLHLIKDNINRVYCENLETLNTCYPSIENLLENLGNYTNTRNLWERDTEDPDFLIIRLGNGRKKSDISIRTPESKFSIEIDPLTVNSETLKKCIKEPLFEEKYEKYNESTVKLAEIFANYETPYEIAEAFSKYDSAPITLSLQQNTFIGIFGTRKYLEKLTRNIIANIIFLHSPTSVKTAFLFPNDIVASKYDYLKNIPHVWNCDKSRRYFAFNINDSKTLLNNIYNQVTTPINSTSILTNEHYVIFVWENRCIDKTALYQYVKNNPSHKQISFIFVAKEYSDLPKECTTLIESDSTKRYSMYVKNANDNSLITFESDQCNDEKLRNALVNLNLFNIDTSISNNILSANVSFLDMFRVGNINDLKISYRWQYSNSHSSLATPIGIEKDGNVIQFDIHEAFHGCHGLIAGTTGSGKSEFLQAYILSMMVNYSPADVNFVLIDFKGDELASPFAGLPHISAVISNLNKKILYRAMCALDAEKKRRQNLFSEKMRELKIDKIDINSYQKLYHSGQIETPLPHLIIIMDEFAQFRNQHPEYMQALIDISQIGRSLGIHLILATQKPDGVVDDQIWSNSRFKFCLKVLTREDSKAVLQCDDAAYLKNPGSCYMQVGYNEIYTQFQSGYCRAQYIPLDNYYNFDDLTVKMINETGEVLSTEVDIPNDIATSTQISVIVEKLRDVSEQYGYTSTPLWKPELPSIIFTDECTIIEEESDFEFIIGLMDIPVETKQDWYFYNFIREGNMAIIGAAGTGKTTLIQSILYQGVCKKTPQHFQYCVIDVNDKSYTPFVNTIYDFGSTIGSDVDINSIDIVFKKIEHELSYRKEFLAQHGFNTFEELYHKMPGKLPFILIILENYVNFREIADQYEESLIDALSSGQAYGLYFIITTNSAEGIYRKVYEQLSRTILFNMSDVNTYKSVLGVKCEIVPENIKGRALIKYNDNAVELQIALALHAYSEYERIQMLKSVMQSYVDTEKVNALDIRPVNQSLPADTIPLHPNSTKEYLTYKSAPISPYSIFLGKDTNLQTDVFADMNIHKKIFICSEHATDYADILLNFVPRNKNCKTWIFTGDEGQQEDILHEIDMSISQKILPIVIIPDFISFYQDISNEDLDKFCNFIKKNPTDISANESNKCFCDIPNNYEPVFITCSCLDKLSGYRDTELFILLCRKASISVFTNGILQDDYVHMMNNNISKIEHSLLEKNYSERTFLVSIDDMYTTTYFNEDKEGL